MTASSATTLVTFLVRTPPNIRSVKLLGSWDNFSREYGMERDKRRGSGYWKGCHTFTNVICDGRVPSAARRGRDGALKMGGTYWYHYRLDDDIEFYNEAEPWTTSCPFLPGQPVNVLNVPIYLPSVERYHQRDNSVGSQIPAAQTMNPEDKYLNPRPPPRPTLPRLATSPSFLSPGGPLTSPLATSPMRPAHGRSMSHPREAPPRRKFGKISVDLKPAENTAVKGNALRNALMTIASPRFAGSQAESDKARRGDGTSDAGSRGPRKRPENQYLAVDCSSQPSVVCSNCSSPLRSPTDTPLRDAFRTEPFRPADRRDRSVSRPGRSTTPRVAGSLLPNPFHDDRISLGPNVDGLEDGGYMVTCKLDLRRSGAAPPVDLNSKRLPTLPNSPSSVLEEELATNQAYQPDLDPLMSHFSESTTKSPVVFSPGVEGYADPSRFSEWTQGSDATSPSSMTSASTVNNDYGLESVYAPNPKQEPVAAGPSIQISSPNRESRTAIPVFELEAPVPPASITSDHGLQVSGLYITKDPNMAGHHEPPRSNPGDDSSVYSSMYSTPRSTPSPAPPPALPPRKSSLQASHVTHGLTYRSENSSTPLAGFHDQMGVDWCQSPNKTADVHTMLQDLIDEMSYLGSYIQDGNTAAAY